MRIRPLELRSVYDFIRTSHDLLNDPTGLSGIEIHRKPTIEF